MIDQARVQKSILKKLTMLHFGQDGRVGLGGSEVNISSFYSVVQKYLIEGGFVHIEIFRSGGLCKNIGQ